MKYLLLISILSLINSFTILDDISENLDYLKSNDFFPNLYDVRKKYPQCFQAIKNTNYSVFASATLNLQWKICLKTNGKEYLDLSDAYLRSCLPADSSVEEIYKFLVSKGAPTSECIPEKLEQCPEKCIDGSEMKLYKGKSFKSVKGVDEFNQSIYYTGPLHTSYYAYDDLKKYVDGIYEHKEGESKEKIGVIVHGFGKDFGNAFFTAQNNWGDKWGEKGTFRIRQGDAVFEEQAWIIEPDI